jgi:transcriptional regulator with XRE-family HTH domain
MAIEKRKLMATIPGFPARLRELRAITKLSQAKLARKSGVEVALIQQVEQGLRTNVTLAKLLLLAAGLGCPASKLVDGLKVVMAESPKVV